MELYSILLYQLKINVKNFLCFTKYRKPITTPSMISLTLSRSNALFSKDFPCLKKYYRAILTCYFYMIIVICI